MTLLDYHQLTYGTFLLHSLSFIRTNCYSDTTEMHLHTHRSCVASLYAREIEDILEAEKGDT